MEELFPFLPVRAVLRRSRLAVRAARGIGPERVRDLDPGFGMGTFWAFVAAMLEALRPGRDRDCDHPLLALRATRTVGRGSDRVLGMLKASAGKNRPSVR